MSSALHGLGIDSRLSPCADFPHGVCCGAVRGNKPSLAHVALILVFITTESKPGQAVLEGAWVSQLAPIPSQEPAGDQVSPCPSHPHHTFQEPA